MICIEDEEGYEDLFAKFYKDLFKNSINIKSFKAEYNAAYNDYESIKWAPTKRAFITAPFYFDSSIFSKKR
jgi:hypothetical protein